jgi:hypothetical protein
MIIEDDDFQATPLPDHSQIKGFLDFSSSKLVDFKGKLTSETVFKGNPT